MSDARNTFTVGEEDETGPPMSELEPMEPAEAVALYLDDREPELSEKTLMNQRYRLRSFVAFCEEHDVTNLNDLGGRDLHRFRVWRRRGSDDDGGSDSTMSVYTMDDLSEASGIATEKLTAMDDSELEALAESVSLGNDDDGDGDGVGDDEPIELDELSEAVREKLVAIVAKAREAGIDLSELGLDEQFDLDDLPEGEAAAAAALAADGGSSGSGSGSSDVSLTTNVKRVAQSHGLPTNWQALAGIDLPPSLADVPMSDEGLAAAINKAHGVDAPGDRVVTPSLVANVRDKGVEPDSFGVQVEDLESDGAGLNNNLGEEQPLPTKTVTNRVESHMARTGQSSTPDSSGGSLEDVDGS